MTRRRSVQVRRVYDDPECTDGARILVDRLWPRGVRKGDVGHDEWLRGIAPSTELRRWYGHRPERFDGFAQRYRKELRSGEAADALESLKSRARLGPITLLTATRDIERSAAAVLAGILRDG